MKILKTSISICIMSLYFYLYSNAQIVYTDVVPDITKSCTGVCTQVYNLDLNGDGTTDFAIKSFHSVSISWKTGQKNETSYVDISPIGNNSFVSPGPLYQVQMLSLNDTIKSNSIWHASSTNYLKYFHQLTRWDGFVLSSSSYGLWNNAVDKFVGLKIIAGGQIYYGWVRLNVTVTLASSLFTVKDYAYNSIPNQSILAGETSCATPTVTLSASGPLTFCNGDSVTLSANGTGYQYQWKKNGVNISGAVSQAYIAKAAGKYKCTATNSCGSKISKVDTVKVPCRNSDASFFSMTNSELERLSVYPNPATSIVIVKIPSDEAGEIQIINLFGQIVFSEKINSEQTKIDVSKFSRGIYVVRWSSVANNESKRFSVIK